MQRPLFYSHTKIPLWKIFLGMHRKKKRKLKKQQTVHKLSWQTKWHAKREGKQNSYFRLLLWSLPTAVGVNKCRFKLARRHSSLISVIIKFTLIDESPVGPLTCANCLPYRTHTRTQLQQGGNAADQTTHSHTHACRS